MIKTGEELRLLVVRHSGTGEPQEGRALIQEIRRKASTTTHRLVFFHEASKMTLASPGYALAFREIDAELAPRVAQIVCAIPGAIPRMMAHSVSVVSTRDWRIFKSTGEALNHLRAIGLEVTPDRLTKMGAVELV